MVSLSRREQVAEAVELSVDLAALGRQLPVVINEFGEQDGEQRERQFAQQFQVGDGNFAGERRIRREVVATELTGKHRSEYLQQRFPRGEGWREAQHLPKGRDKVAGVHGPIYDRVLSDSRS